MQTNTELKEKTGEAGASDSSKLLGRRLEIINPSDKCWLFTDDTEAACAGVVFIGGGKYALRDDNDDSVLPLFIMGTEEDINNWWKEKFNRTLQEYMETKPSKQIADALDTFKYAGSRSSMNNIGAAAQAFSKQCRRSA